MASRHPYTIRQRDVLKEYKLNILHSGALNKKHWEKLIEAQLRASVVQIEDGNEMIHTLHCHHCKCAWSEDDQSDLFDLVSNNKIWISHPNQQRHVHQNEFTFELWGCALGCFTDPFTFNQHGPIYRCMQNSSAPSVEFDFNTDKMRLFIPGKPFQGLYKLESLFQHIQRSFVVHKVNDSYVFYIHLDYIPLMWNQPPNKLFWNRTIRLPALPTDDIGHCSTLMLHLRTSLDVVSDLLDKLQSSQFSIWCAPINMVRPNNRKVVSYLKGNVHWTLKCLLSMGFKVLDQLSMDDIRMMESNLDSLNRLIQGLPRTEPVVDFWKEFQQQLVRDQRYSISEPKSELPEYALIPKITVTPTKESFQPPEYVKTNRVIRHFKPENFIIACFREEHETKMSTMKPVSLSQPVQRIKEILKNGIAAGGRHYQFLGCSNSQLRSHGVWMYASDGTSEHSVDSIRHWMGDLTTIRCVAVYVSRLGQFFSSSAPAVDLSEDKYSIKEIEDITRNDHCFTDGVGTISQETASEVALKRSLQVIPSVFQIRLAGCKGLLSVDPTLDGHQVCLRPSMKKFESNHRKLEVVDYARPHRLSLNKQVITILADRGVKDEVFFHLHENSLKNLVDLFNTNEAARRELDNVICHIDFTQLLKSGINLISDPFFRSLLFIRYKENLFHLVEKTKIRIPTSDGRLLIGIADECNVLQSGQVFVQYSETLKVTDTNYLIHVGDVVVAKNPCFHPGDIRKFQAVDCPQLHHLNNCIVFPVAGERPHPNEMSGSDLDGDMYWVCWLPELIPPRDNYPPMEFPKPPKTTLDHTPTKSDVIEYYGEYIRNDQLGTIGNAHLVHADAEESGIYSAKCIELARIHSDAVDFSKSGTFPRVHPNLRPKVYPDFMMKQDQKQYSSEKILGKIFRNAMKLWNSFNVYRDVMLNSPLFTGVNAQLQEIFKTSGIVDSDIEKANGHYRTYSQEIQHLLTKYGFSEESQLFSTDLFSNRGKKVTHGDIYEIAEIIKKEVTFMQNKFKDLFQSSCADCDDVRVAHSWYKVAYEDGNFRSFAWIGHHVIAREAKKLNLDSSTDHNDSDVKVAPHASEPMPKLPSVVAEVIKANNLLQIPVLNTDVSVDIYIKLENQDRACYVFDQLYQSLGTKIINMPLYALENCILLRTSSDNKILNIHFIYDGQMNMLLEQFVAINIDDLQIWFCPLVNWLKRQWSSSGLQYVTVLHLFAMTQHFSIKHNAWADPEKFISFLRYFSNIENVFSLNQIEGDLWDLPENTMRKIHMLLFECLQLVTLSGTLAVLDKPGTTTDVVRNVHTLSSDASVLLRHDLTLVENFLSTRTGCSVKINQVEHRGSTLYAVEGIGDPFRTKQLKELITNFEEVAGEVRDGLGSYSRKGNILIFEGTDPEGDSFYFSSESTKGLCKVAPRLTTQHTVRSKGIPTSRLQEWEDVICMLSDKYDIDLLGNLRIIVRFSRFRCRMENPISGTMRVGEFQNLLYRSKYWNWSHSDNTNVTERTYSVVEQMVPTHTTLQNITEFLNREGLVVEPGVDHTTVCTVLLDGTIQPGYEQKAFQRGEILFDENFKIKDFRLKAVRWGALSLVRHANLTDENAGSKADISIQLQSMRYIKGGSTDAFMMFSDPNLPVLSKCVHRSFRQSTRFADLHKFRLPKFTISKEFQDRVTFVRQKVTHTFKYPRNVFHTQFDHFIAHVKVDVSKARECAVSGKGHFHFRNFYDINVVMPSVPPLYNRREMMKITEDVLDLSMKISDIMTEQDYS